MNEYKSVIKHHIDESLLDCIIDHRLVDELEQMAIEKSKELGHAVKRVEDHSGEYNTFHPDVLNEI